MSIRFRTVMRKPSGGRSGREDAGASTRRQRWEAAVQRQTRSEKRLSSAEEVHQIRVLAKRLRAYLRLFRGTIPEKILELEERRIQRIARNLGQARDKTICIQTLRWLAAKEKKESHREWVRAALLRLSEAGAGLDVQRISRARSAIETRRQRLLTLIDRYSPREGKLEEALRREYGRSRRGMREAFREESPEAFHEWRKRVKRLGYQTECFCSSSRGRCARLEAELIRLGRLLGKLQDLHVLKSWIQAQSLSSRSKLVRLLEKWMSWYRKEVEREGRRCFYMRKREFVSLLLN
ncbi:MAG: CHAD domain-containing protein [Candidatus Methylacidiphilaceae bacterium]